VATSASSWTPTGTAGTNDWFSIDDVQLQVVPVGLGAANPTFERTEYVWDWVRCARFLPVWSASSASSRVGVGQAFAATSSIHQFEFSVPTRVAVTGIVSTPSLFTQFTAGLSTQVCNAISFNSGGTFGCGFIAGSAGVGLVAGNACLLTATSATAQLLFTGAEI